MKMKAAQVVCECLLEQGVDTVFGYPGGTILNIYDALYGYEGKIRHILTAHEQGASHAADGYARSTGKVGVCFATSGPGATNLTTGIATAYYDSSPVIFLTVNVPEPLIGKDTFQEVDITGITMPITKANFLVRDAASLADTLRTAFAIARSGRPGPVLIDILKNVTAEEVDYKFLPLSEHVNHGRLKEMMDIASHDLTSREREPDQEDVDKLLEMIEHAQKPVVLCGGGVIRSEGAVPEFRKFFQTLNTPVISTMMGGGACPGNHPLFAGMVGMHGTYEANMAMQNCDVLIAIGSRFDDRVVGLPSNFAQPGRKIIHIDIDPSTISKRVKVDIPIVGDVKEVIADMLNLLETTDKRPDPEKLAAWQNRINGWREKDCLHYENSDTVIKPQYVLQKLQEVGGDDMIVATDVGQHQMWCAQFLKFRKPRHWLTSGGLGTMGVGLPYAIGACVAHPDKPVVCVTGDGSIQMNIQELATAKQLGVAPKIILLNNNYLGMVRQWQELEYDRRYSHSHMEVTPDFKALAEAYGHIGIVVDRPEDVEQALKDAFGKYKDKLVFLDFHVNPTENVWPMVKAGRGLTEMILGSEKI